MLLLDHPQLITILFFNTENLTRMPTKPRTIPPALNLRPEVTLLTEFAQIATSPQSPLVREVSGENAETRRSEGDSPPPQLVDPRQMVCDVELERERERERDASLFPVPFLCCRNLAQLINWFELVCSYSFDVNDNKNCVPVFRVRCHPRRSTSSYSERDEVKLSSRRVLLRAIPTNCQIFNAVKAVKIQFTSCLKGLC